MANKRQLYSGLLTDVKSRIQQTRVHAIETTRLRSQTVTLKIKREHTLKPPICAESSEGRFLGI